ncbi:Leader peptidase (Prepilin peptidase) [Candidatus Desulforudis audaxviator]|nr:Leader peptidase (Prepilin peptidase) [Candidatus Desulforudis audaxviator]
MRVVLEGLLIFVLGSIVGSFLNVCIHRLPVGESVVFPPSRCVSCGAKLGFIDLVPVFSFLYLRGRCRRCGVPISWHYPLVECAAGLLFVLAWLRFGATWATPGAWALFAVLLIATLIDLRHGIIPDRVVLAGLVLGLPLVALQSWAALLWGAAAFLGAGLFMLAIAVISRGGMGGGDIKLAALMGLYLGPAGVALALFLAFLAGGTVAVLLLATGRKGRKDPVPFGPYLALGGIVAALWGREIISWYFGLWG